MILSPGVLDHSASHILFLIGANVPRKPKRTLEEIVADLDKLEKARDRLDKRYWARSEEFTTQWENLMAEMEALPDKK